MKHTSGLWTSILTLLLVVTLLFLGGQSRPMPVWDKRLMPPGRVRQAYNPRKNRNVHTAENGTASIWRFLMKGTVAAWADGAAESAPKSAIPVKAVPSRR
jgi:hypothetical protein